MGLQRITDQHICDFIDRVADHYDAIMDQVKLKDEWPMVKEIMSTNYRECSLQNACAIMLQNEALFPNVSTLVKIAPLIPIKTADCKRGLSRYNLIKTKVMSVQSAH